MRLRFPKQALGSPAYAWIMIAGERTVNSKFAGSASGAVVFSAFFWLAALEHFTGLIGDGIWRNDSEVHFCGSDCSTAPGLNGDARVKTSGFK